MIEIKVKDWMQLKRLININKRLEKLRYQNKIGYAKYIHTWKATLSSPNRIRIYECIEVLNQITIKEKVNKGFIPKYKLEQIWHSVSKLDTYVGIIDYDKKFVFCGSKEIIEFMKNECRLAEYKKNCDWKFIDARNQNIKIDKLLEF